MTLPESSTRTPLSAEQKSRNEAAKRVILFTVFLDILGFGIIIPQLGVYASQFGASPAMVGLLASTYSLMSFLSTPGWGRLSDRVGRRPVLLYSIFGTSIGYVIFAFAHSLPLLFLARFIDGITAGNISTAQAYLSDITEPEDRSKTFGLFGAIFGVGFALGPAVGAALTHLPSFGGISWSGNLGLGLFTAALSLINWALALKRLPETLSPEVRRANTASDAKRGGGFASQFINLSGFQRAFKLPGLNIMIAISFFATLAFATLQGTFTLFLIKQYARPQVQTYIQKNPDAAINEARRESAQAKVVAAPSGEGGESAVSLGDGENEPYPASMGGDFNSSTRNAPDGMTWRQIEKLLVRPRAAQMAALIFASIGVVALLVQGGLIGPLKKRFGEMRLIVAGTLLMAIGLALVPFPKTFWWEFPVMGLLAFGNSIATPVLSALVSELSPENERGEMIGVFQSVGSLGRIFGPNVGGSLFSALGSGMPYFAGSIIMMVSFAFALVLKKSCPPHEIDPEPSL